MKIKGTILELNSDTAVVMTSKCDFLEIKRTDSMELGQEIFFSSKDLIINKPPARWTLALVACLALLLFCVPVYTAIFPGTAAATVAYVSMDINPSLEMAVDTGYRVIETRAFNEDGTKLLERASVQWRPVGEAVAQLIKTAAQLNYLQEENNPVLICVTPGKNNEVLSSDLGLKISKEITTVNTGQAGLQIINSSKEQHREALRKGMSPGRYALWAQNDAGDDSRLIQYKTGKLADIIDQSQSSPDHDKSNTKQRGEARNQPYKELDNSGSELTPGKTKPGKTDQPNRNANANGGGRKSSSEADQDGAPVRKNNHTYKQKPSLTPVNPGKKKDNTVKKQAGPPDDIPVPPGDKDTGAKQPGEQENNNPPSNEEVVDENIKDKPDTSKPDKTSKDSSGNSGKDGSEGSSGKSETSGKSENSDNSASSGKSGSGKFAGHKNGGR